MPGESHGQRSLAATVHGVTRVGLDLATKPPPAFQKENVIGPFTGSRKQERKYKIPRFLK